MGLSLPEERLRFGKSQGFGTQPVRVHIDEDPLAKYRDRARDVYQFGDKFSTTERDEIIAELVLGRA